MSGATRTCTAFVLALAFATFPLVLDQCAASCELARLTSGSAPAAACHHATSPDRHIGERPGACGHDHAAALSAITYAAPSTTRTLNSVAFVTPAPTAATAHAVVSREHAFANPPSRPPALRLSLSLRI